MKRGESGGPSLRLLRVGESIRHALSEVLFRGEIHASELSGASITVTEVRPSPDLRHATVFVMPLGGGDKTHLIKALNKLAGPMAHEVSKRVRLKYTPRLNFRLDESFDEANHIDQLLRSPKVQRDLDKREDEE